MAPPDQAPPHKTQPLFAYAAAEVARQRGAGAVSGLEETIVDLLQGRAFELYGEGLYQYLAISLGDLARARDAFDGIRQAVAGASRGALTRPPGMRARLYRLARKAAVDAGAAGRKDAAAPDRVPWRRPRASGARSYLGAVDRLRRGALDPAATELLELRYARELELEEVAFVLDRPAAELAGTVDDAEARARSLFRETPELLGDGLVEAFALDAPTPSIPAPGTGNASVHVPGPRPVPSAADVPGTPGSSDDGEPRPSLPSGTVIGGRYAVSERVGAGAFGEVYRAHDTEVAGHVVALKLLHQVALTDEARAHGLRELRLIASVFHPSIVQFKDFGWHERRLWFVMPWYEGETLEDRIARAPLTRREARRIFEPLARALATMHEAGVRHQDVKPDNIFLARIRGFGGQEGDGILPVLLDLGVAATEAEMLLAGTPTYFAPEVAHLYAFLPDPPPIGPKADVFSLALSLRNALEPETQDDVPAGALEAFVRRRATRGPALPRSRDLRYLRPLWRRWLSVDPAARPSAEELAEALAVLTEPEERRERRRRVLRWLVPLLVGLGIAFGAGAYALDARAKLKEREAREMANRAELFEERYREVRERFRAKAFTEDELLRELAGSEARGDALARDLADTQRSLRQSRDRRESLTAELFDANKRIGEVRRELRAVEESLTETEGALAETRTDLEERRRELAVAQATLTERDQALAAAESSLAETRGTLAEVEQQRQDLDARRRSLEADLAEARSQVAAFESRIDALAADKARLEARIEKLEAAPSPAPSPTPSPGSGTRPRRPARSGPPAPESPTAEPNAVP